MIIIHRGDITYYVKEESIIVGVQELQYLAYTVYSLQNRKPFYGFKRAILTSKPGELDTPTKLTMLGQRYSLRAFATSRPNLDGVDYEVYA